ncbi:MAG: hypothetical protein HDS39_07125 [Bacteroides sp.]|nr:hypothetical protein [Bacteroides sp.]
MNYLKSLALLLLSTSILTSCSQYEDFPADVYSMDNTEANEKNTKAAESDTDGTEQDDTTGSGMISINIGEPEVEDIDYTVTIP